MSHKPNLLSWDQDVAAKPREFHETDNNRPNSAALSATWQYFSFRHIWFSKLLSHQKLSKLFFPIFQMLCHSSKAKEVSRSPENSHLFQKWRTRKLPAILKNIDVWRDVTLVVISRPMFTLETLPPSWSKQGLLVLPQLFPCTPSPICERQDWKVEKCNRPYYTRKGKKRQLHIPLGRNAKKHISQPYVLAYRQINLYQGPKWLIGVHWR